MLQALANRAAEYGPERFKWWKDWRGESVAIVASGSSTRNANVGLLKDRIRCIAIKEAYSQLVPFADVVYGCEAPWWKHRQGLPDFRGLKLAWSDAQIPFPGIERFKIKDKQFDRLLLDDPGIIGAGGHSGFQALNIALQFGAARVLLVGFDMRGSHFYGRNNWMKANNPNESVFPRWIKGMDGAASDLKKWGIEVVNASPVSAVKSFPHMTIEQTLAAWNL